MWKFYVVNLLRVLNNDWNEGRISKVCVWFELVFKLNLLRGKRELKRFCNFKMFIKLLWLGFRFWNGLLFHFFTWFVNLKINMRYLWLYIRVDPIHFLFRNRLVIVVLMNLYYFLPQIAEKHLKPLNIVLQIVKKVLMSELFCKVIFKTQIAGNHFLLRMFQNALRANKMGTSVRRMEIHVCQVAFHAVEFR